MNRKIGVIMSYINMVFEILSTLVLTPFIIRSLGQAEYGVYKLSFSLSAYLLLLDLGVGNAIIRYVAKYRCNNEKELERKFLGVVTIFYFLISIIVLICGFAMIKVFPTAFAKGLTPSEIALGQKLLFITIINVAITIATTAYVNVINAYERFFISKSCTIFSIICRIVFTYIFLKMGKGSEAIVTINLVLTIITRGFLLFYVLFVIKLKPIFKKIDFSLVKEIIIYSSFILLQMIATQLNSSVDTVLIGAIVPASSVIIGIYGVGTQLSQYFQSVAVAITGVLMPGIVNMVENNASSLQLCDEMIRIGRIVFSVLAIILVGFAVFGEQFIVLWVGSENIKAYIVALIFMFLYLFIYVESIGTQILWAKNQHKEQSIFKVLIVLANVFLTVVMIKWDALIGATIATAISLLLGDIVAMNIVFKKKIGISLLYYYKGLLKGLLFAVLITLGFGYLISMLNLSGWFGLVINIIAVCVVYVVCLLLFGFNDYEKNLFSGFIRKIFKKRKEE